MSYSSRNVYAKYGNPADFEPSKDQVDSLVELVKKHDIVIETSHNVIKSRKSQIAQLEHLICNMKQECEEASARIKPRCPHVWHKFRFGGGDFTHWYATCKICGKLHDDYMAYEDNKFWQPVVDANNTLRTKLEKRRIPKRKKL
jgi:hypothetical protein